LSRRRSLLKGSPRSPTGSSAPPSSDSAVPEGTDVESEDPPAADESADESPAQDEAAAGPADPPEQAEGTSEPDAVPDADAATDASSTVEPLSAAIPPPSSDVEAAAPPEEAAASSAAGPEAPIGADGVALSAQPTQPPAPRQELPPGLADMQTPLRPDRQPLPEDFQETPMGGDWYIGTGQPLPEREGAPASGTSKTQAGLPVPMIVGGVVLVGVLLCAGLLVVVF